MKKTTLLLTGLLLLLAAVPGEATTERFTVDGIPVVLKTNTGTPVISATFVLKGGLPHCGVDQAGIEIMLFNAALKGSENFPKAKLQALLSRTGSELTAEALPDYTHLSLQCLRRDLDMVWPAYADVIIRPELAADEVALVKERQLNDVRQMKDDPDSYLRMLADKLHYDGHPYAVQPTGTEESVARLDLKALKEYHAREITKARAQIVLVGDLDRSTAEKMVRSAFGALPAGKFTEPEAQRAKGSETPDTHLEERELPTNYIRGYFHAPSLDEADFVPMSVAIRILRDRLFEEVRTKRNMTYAVYSGLSSRRDNYGLLYVTAVEPDTTLRVMLNEVRAMQTEGITEKELNDQLKVMITRYLMDQQTNASQALELGRYELLGGGFENAERVVERMRKVTTDDIRRVCQKYIRDVDFVMLGDPQKWKDPLAADQPAKAGGDLH